MKKFFMLFALVTLVFGNVGVSAATDGVTGDAILIGISNAQEGPAQFLGKELSKGAAAYFNHVNDKGGIQGRKIKIVQYDDGYEPDKCIKNTKTLIEQDKVFALFGYVGTPTAKAVHPIIQKEKKPFYFPFTGAGFLRDTAQSSHIFNLRASYDMETEAMVDYLVGKGKNKIAIFYQNDAYGRAGLSGTEKAMTKRGLKIVAQGTYERNTTAVNSGLIAIKKGSPDAVIMIGTYKPCAAFVKKAKGFGMKDVEFLNISFVGSKALASELGSAGDGVIVTQCVPFPWDADIPAVKEYQALLKKYFPDSEPGFVSLEGFLDAKLFVEILTKAGAELTQEGIIKTSESISDLDLGVGDNISYSANDHQGFNKVFMTRIKNGKFEKL